MTDDGNTRQQLLDELAAARERIRELEAQDAGRQRTEAKLRRSERQSRSMLDCASQFLALLDADGTMMDVNETALGLGEIARADVLGKPFWACPWWAASPEQQADVRAGVLRAAAGECFRYEAQHPTPDGDVRHVDGLLKPVRDEAGEVSFIIAEGLDVTERRRAEQELRRSEAFQRTLTEALPDFVFVLDDAGTIQQVSRVQPGHRKEEVIGQRATAFVQPEYRDAFEETFRQARKTGRLQTFEAMVDLPDGQHCFLNRLSPATLAEGQTGVLLVATDITERKQAEEERLSLERQVRHAQKLESLGILAGGIAHDFNNLLVCILGSTDLVLDALPPRSPLRQDLEGISRAARSAAALTNQMLAYSGKGRFVVEDVDLGVLVEDISPLLRASLAKKARLQLELSDELPAISADASQIRQVVMNLVINAAEAVGEDPGSITVSARMGTCGRGCPCRQGIPGANEWPEGRRVFLTVEDTGCGMDDETKARIFEPFFSTKFTGRGLGMAAVHGVLRGHHAGIAVESEIGRGTTVQVHFESLNRLAKRAQRPDGPKESWHGAGTILLVDDERAVRKVISQMLESLGFSVLAAADGEAALARFRERHQEIACVLLDLKMPRMDGEETFEQLRKIDRAVPVILSSGYNEQESTKRFGGKGLAAFLQKPYQLTTLSEKLRAVLATPNTASPHSVH